MFVRQILMTPKEFSSNREQAQFPAPKTFEWAKQSDAHYTPPSVVSFSYIAIITLFADQVLEIEWDLSFVNSLKYHITISLATDHFSKIRIHVY